MVLSQRYWTPYLPISMPLQKTGVLYEKPSRVAFLSLSHALQGMGGAFSPFRSFLYPVHRPRCCCLNSGRNRPGEKSEKALGTRFFFFYIHPFPQLPARLSQARSRIVMPPLLLYTVPYRSPALDSFPLSVEKNPAIIFFQKQKRQ